MGHEIILRFAMVPAAIVKSNCLSETLRVRGCATLCAVGKAKMFTERNLRMILVGAAAVFLSLSGQSASAQEKTVSPEKKLAIRAGRLIDGKSDKPIENALILVEGDKIVSVTPGGAPAPDVELIDLSKATVLPGFVDTHTHVLLNGDVLEDDYAAQLLKQSIPYRAILAARNARIALDHGFTTLRDLETEGAMYADVDVKTAINLGEVPGPHMQVATRAMAPTGLYPLLGYSWELTLPKGVQTVDGVEGARKAVREQISFGADWIKYYSDHAYYFAPDGVLHSKANFTDEEAHAIVTKRTVSAGKWPPTPWAATALPPHFVPA
jgi:imidazolonepropionase-like amidohydrolase